jgi:hypothetical protein
LPAKNDDAVFSDAPRRPVRRQAWLLRAYKRCGIGIALSIANLVLSDDVSLAFNVNHSAHIRWRVSACPSCGKRSDSLKTKKLRN